MTPSDKNAKVYIILVNHKNWEDTLECVESLLNSTYSNFQILIVDNSSTMEPLERIQQWARGNVPFRTAIPDLITRSVPKPFASFRSLKESQLGGVFDERVLLIKAQHNHGFSAANNVGLKYAMKCDDFEFAWVLNNDTVPDKDALKHLVSFMQRPEHSKLGMTGSKVMEYDRPKIIQSAGGGTMIKPLVYATLIGAGAEDQGQFDVDFLKMDFVAGTSMFVRKAFIREVGLMEEDYFLYCEEPDWAERGRKAGWELGYTHQAKVFHKGGAATGGKGYSAGPKSSTAFSDYYFQRSKILFTKKFHWYWLPILYLSFGLVIFNRIRRGQFGRLKLLVSIMLHPKRLYPGTLSK